MTRCDEIKWMEISGFALYFESSGPNEKQLLYFRSCSTLIKRRVKQAENLCYPGWPWSQESCYDKFIKRTGTWVKREAHKNQIGDLGNICHLVLLFNRMYKRQDGVQPFDMFLTVLHILKASQFLKQILYLNMYPLYFLLKSLFRTRT